MFICLRKPGIFVLLVVISLLFSGDAAWADIIYTVTETGTITNGTSGGTFGVSGINLTGQTFSVTQTFDQTSSNYSAVGTAFNVLYPTTSTAVITIQGYNYIISSYNFYNQYFIYSKLGGGNNDEIITETYLPDLSAHYEGSVYAASTIFLTTDALSQELLYSIPATILTSASFLAPDGTSFEGTISTLALNQPPALVPEPHRRGYSASVSSGWAGYAPCAK